MAGSTFAVKNSARSKAMLAAFIAIIVAASFASGYFSRTFISSEQQTVTVKIGALLPLTGDLSTYGKRNQGALQLAIEDINSFAEAAGSKFRFQLVVEDTGTDPQTARSRIEALAAQGVKLFLGPMSSGEVSQVKPFADANKLVVVSQSSTAPALSIPGDFVFRVVPPDTYQGRALAKVVWSSGFTKAIVIYRNDAWGVGLRDSFEKNFKALGGTTESIAYDTGAKEFSAEVSRAADLASQMGTGTAIVLISFEEGIQFIKLAAQNPVLSKLTWFGTDGLANNAKLISEAGAEAIALGGIASTNFIPTANPMQEEFKRRFRQRFGDDPDPYSMNSYDAAWLLALSVMLTGSDDGTKIASVLPQVTARYYGITGTITLDASGDRSAGDYGVFKVVQTSTGLAWKLVAVYHIDTDTFAPVGS